MANPENLPLPKAVQKLSGVQSYVEKKSKPKEFITKKDVSEGMSPFGPPPEYNKIIDELYESGLLYDSGIRYPSNINLDPAKSNIRERHELPYNYDISIGLAGSNEILERTLTTLRTGTLVFGIGPHFTGFHKSLKVINKSKYGPISPPLTQHLEEILKETVPNPIRFPKKPDVLYLAVPDARGDDVDPELLWNFTDKWCDKGVMVILDRALADFSEESNHTHRNLVEIRSFSKSIGLPGDGFSYALGSNEYINRLNSHMKDYNYRSKSVFMAEVFNRISDPDIINPHLNMVRSRTKEIKTKLMNTLEKYNITYLPTSNSTPLQFIDGENEDFFDNLDLPTTPGSGFFYTYDISSNTPLTNRYVRIGLPSLDYNDPKLDLDKEMDIIAKRIKGAINISNQYNVESFITLSHNQIL